MRRREWILVSRRRLGMEPFPAEWKRWKGLCSGTPSGCFGGSPTPLGCCRQAWTNLHPSPGRYREVHLICPSFSRTTSGVARCHARSKCIFRPSYRQYAGSSRTHAPDPLGIPVPDRTDFQNSHCLYPSPMCLLVLLWTQRNVFFRSPRLNCYPILLVLVLTLGLSARAATCPHQHRHPRFPGAADRVWDAVHRAVILCDSAGHRVPVHGS